MTTADSIQNSSLPEIGFKVVIACEDNATSLRALELYQRLSHRLSGNFPLNHSVWKFSNLQGAKLREKASLDAIKADMIILSVEGESPLPHHVRAWLESCLVQSPEHSRALVVLLGQPAEHLEAAAICDYLRHLTLVRQADLFVHGPESSAGDARFSWTTTFSSPDYNGLRSEPPRTVQPRWGINE